MLKHINQFLNLCEGYKVKSVKDTATDDTTKHAVSEISHFVIYVTSYTGLIVSGYSNFKWHSNGLTHLS